MESNRNRNGISAAERGVLIAGGGLAAQRCCESLRALGYEGGIRIVGDESRPPYDRPPLSKEVLTGTREPETIGLRAPSWYEDNAVELLLSDAAVALDPGIKTITLASGSTLHYDA
ncbi:MAG: FAD-dependent oxidoreductase, partial [Solirubrobacterales bacterium]